MVAGLCGQLPCLGRLNKFSKGQLLLHGAMLSAEQMMEIIEVTRSEKRDILMKGWGRSEQGGIATGQTFKAKGDRKGNKGVGGSSALKAE